MAIKIVRTHYLPDTPEASTIYLTDDMWWRGYTNTILLKYKAIQGIAEIYSTAIIPEVEAALSANNADEFTAMVGVATPADDNTFTETAEFDGAIIENVGTVENNMIYTWSGAVFVVQNSGVFSLSVSHGSRTGVVVEFTLILKKAVASTITFWDNIDWGTITADMRNRAGTDIYSFLSVDDGATWKASLIGQNMF